MNERKEDLLNLDCLIVTGKTAGENIAAASTRIGHQANRQPAAAGGIAVLKTTRHR
ncbi:MAG: hypothetical protein ACLUOI_30670 [Eisenbergiella sp.]